MSRADPPLHVPLRPNSGEIERLAGEILAGGYKTGQETPGWDGHAVCTFHHLRGIHRGILRCVGRAPDGLRWEMGIRPKWTPRAVYRSGDISIQC